MKLLPIAALVSCPLVATAGIQHHGGPVWERFLREGFVVVVADYRGGDWNTMNAPSSSGLVTAIDDGLAMIDYVKALPYVGGSRLNLCGVSLGGNLVSYLISKVSTIHAAVLGAPAAMWFLGVAMPGGGRQDRLLPIATTLHDLLAQAGKPVRMDVYEHGYHDFVLGPQGQNRPDLPRGEILLEGALDGLETSVAFVKTPRASR